MNLPSKIASTWFGDKERAIATAIGSMSTPVGALITFILPSTVISQDDFTNKETGHIDFCYYIMIQTLMITLFTVPALGLMREGPPTPPSVVANEFDQMTFAEGMKDLISNRNYVLLFLVYVIVYGVIASQAAVVANLADQNGFTLNEIIISCVVYYIAGIMTSIILGKVLDSSLQYRRVLMVVTGCAVLSTGLHIFSMTSGNPYFEIPTMLFVGPTLLPISSVCFSFAGEVAYPVPEAQSIGMMIMFALIYGTGAGTLCSKLSESDTHYPLFFWTACCLLGFILAYFVEEDLRRMQLDDVKNSEYVDEDEVRRQSFEQRSEIIRETGVENAGGDLKFKFDFQP